MPSLDLTQIKPDMFNLVTVGLMAVIFITFCKFLFAKWQVPGFSELFGSL